VFGVRAASAGCAVLRGLSGDGDGPWRANAAAWCAACWRTRNISVWFRPACGRTRFVVCNPACHGLLSTATGSTYQVRPTGSSSPPIAFILGLFPGLGAIYNGQYNKGLIHIAIFASIIVGLASDMEGGIKALLSISLAGFVFYCAFEAMRTAQAKNSGTVAAPDPLESWSKERPIGPIILIGLGALLLLNNFQFFDFIRLGRFWPLILIGVGFYMFRNRLSGRQ
jgi:hypothetical protein